MKGLRTVNLHDDEQGEIRLLVAVPRRGDPWGVLAPLRGTVWGDLIAVVSGEAMSHALHGFATPLAREMGVHPRYLGRRITGSAGICAEFEHCINAGPACTPGQKELPDCYEAPNLPPETSLIATQVALAWRSGRRVLVVVGDEFNLL